MQPCATQRMPSPKSGNNAEGTPHATHTAMSTASRQTPSIENAAHYMQHGFTKTAERLMRQLAKRTHRTLRSIRLAVEQHIDSL